MPANKPSKKKPTKANKEYLGYCDDPTNKELLDRLSDEENEYVYDYFPLMIKQTQVIKATGRFFFVCSKVLCINTSCLFWNELDDNQKQSGTNMQTTLNESTLLNRTELNESMAKNQNELEQETSTVIKNGVK